MAEWIVSVPETDWIHVLADSADELVFAAENQSFSALPGLNPDQMKSAAEQCREKGVLCSVLMDRLYSQTQLSEAEKWLKILKPYAAHVYFSDPAVFQLSEELNMKEKLIFSPQTLAVSVKDIQWWMNLGIGSVSVSPLLSLPEIMEILHACPTAETLIHGYALMSVSGRLLLDAYQEKIHAGRSLMENRNLFLQEESRSQKMRIYENNLGTCIYTDYVQQSFAEISDFAKNEKIRFRISGEFLNKEETVQALHAYQAVLQGENWQTAMQSYQKAFPSLPLSEGYYSQRTIL